VINQQSQSLDSADVEESMKSNGWTKTNEDRRAFIGGSHAKIIMGEDEAALHRL
jgi:hypothetical protein